MSDQNFKNHPRYVPLYHFITPLIIVALLVGSGIGLVNACCACTGGACSGNAGLHNALLLFGSSLTLLFVWWYSRSFALKVQDRAIRAEENFRHFILSGKPLDSRLTMRQIVGLRFASDAEFEALAKQAVDENLSEKQIKMAISNWRPDLHRA